MIRVVSPLSGYDNVTLLTTIATENLIQSWRHYFNIDIAAELHGHREIYLFLCNQTQLQFFWPLDLAGSDNLYRQLGEFPWYYKEQKWEYKRCMRDIDEHDKVLEVGCGKGHFIETLIRQRRAQAQGIELNAHAVDYARARKLPVALADLYQFATGRENSFDVVCCFQVLEHIANPREFLQSLLALAKPGGKVIISVPNGTSFLKYSDNLLDRPPHHMTRWCRKTMYELTRLFPLMLEYFSDEPLADYHVDGYLPVQFSRCPQTWPLPGIYSRISRALSHFLKRYPQVCHMIRGHSLYVCFRKTEAL